MLPAILLLTGAAGVANAYTIVAGDTFMFKNIDPIVMPGEYKSHMHTFMGSDAVTINTTTSAELRKGCTSAQSLNDQSVYWTPTLYYTGAGSDYTPLAPYRFSAYYENIAEAEIAIPEDYKVVVGNAAGTTQADVDAAGTTASWFCEGDSAPASKEAAAFPTTTCSTHLQHIVRFHDCVNPTNISEHSYSGRQNLPNTNRCPTGQSRIPQLRFSIRYDLRKTISSGWSGAPPLTLACGSSFCAHGDFINGWDKTALTNMLNATSKTEYMYINGSLQTGSGGDPTCGPTDADPNNGTNDYLKSVAMMAAKKMVKRAMSFFA
ncbi:hypothetical protein BP5796_01593 [Coleophoma crateriformis]|uniref:DUF1996 domain-containing protein n=1 Tax=Coleophoma crateriformis TaxID=565419 RepID=A0A3D8T121_9HELO|nr:hypothetical protein BP5796_01593 [Coleophoma crateriformis]